MNDTQYTSVLVPYSLGNSKQPGFCPKKPFTKASKIHKTFWTFCLLSEQCAAYDTKEPSKSFFAWFSLSNSYTTLSCTTVNKECINSLLNCTNIYYDKISSVAKYIHLATLESESDKKLYWLIQYLNFHVANWSIMLWYYNYNSRPCYYCKDLFFSLKVTVEKLKISFIKPEGATKWLYVKLSTQWGNTFIKFNF